MYILIDEDRNCIKKSSITEDDITNAKDGVLVIIDISNNNPKELEQDGITWDNLRDNF